ncbi:MAG: hypothetical protein CBB72_016400 [Muricauda sp. TMED12]|nr:MAG: hypothetical protein CBB72_016400 [Muricauda sp. TMED12]
MLNIEEVLAMWKKDSVIDEMSLDESSRDTAKLHSKYLEMMTVSKLQLRKREAEFKVLLRDKWLWYNDKMPKEDIESRGWSYDPFNGLSKPLKTDMDRYYDADDHIQSAQAKIHYLEELISTLKEIMDNVKWRHQNIKNMIEWRKFTSGM